MKQDVGKAIMKWVEDKFRSKRKVYISWFGGGAIVVEIERISSSGEE